MKVILTLSCSAIATFFTVLFGGWNDALTTLCVFMVIDYILGVIICFVYKKSPKTITGGASSKVMLIGLVKKVSIIFLVIIGARADLLFSTNFIEYGVIYSFILNELLSIVENLGIMNVPIPKAILSAIDILNKRGEENDNTNNTA